VVAAEVLFIWAFRIGFKANAEIGGPGWSHASTVQQTLHA
jgi:hypothetical protein